jgi:hypothetical protein
MKQTLNGTELVSYSSDSGSLGITSSEYINRNSTTGDYYYIQLNDWYPWYEKEVHHWFPSVSYITEKSRVEQAFRILGKLIEKKVIKNITTKKFIELVNEISQVI